MKKNGSGILHIHVVTPAHNLMKEFIMQSNPAGCYNERDKNFSVP